MRKSYLYKAKINRQTEANCNDWLRLCCNLYNLALEQRIKSYEKHGKFLSAFDQQKQLPELKEAFPEFKAVGSQVLQDVIERLDRTFNAFYQRLKEKKGKTAGFPRFRSCRRYDSFTLKQCGWKLEGRYLRISNVGTFKLFLSRPIEGTIKTVTIKRKCNGWFVSFSCDNVPEERLTANDNAVGIDVGLTDFCTDSTGKKIANPKCLAASQKLLRKKQRSLCRKQKGSNRRNKARILVAKAHDKIVNQRKDFLHKTANEYIHAYGSIYVEKLELQRMIDEAKRDKKKWFTRRKPDAPWGMFFDMLSYKAEEAGRQVVKVDPADTSCTCSECDTKIKKSYHFHTFKCPSCGLRIDRDVNAAINILRAGQALQALTTTMVAVA